MSVVTNWIASGRSRFCSSFCPKLLPDTPVRTAVQAATIADIDTDIKSSDVMLIHFKRTTAARTCGGDDEVERQVGLCGENRPEHDEGCGVPHKKVKCSLLPILQYNIIFWDGYPYHLSTQ